MDTFQTVWTLSRLSGHFPDCPVTFQIVRTLSRLSGNFPDCPDYFRTYTGHFQAFQRSKLSGRAKTFRVAMLPRYRPFSVSEVLWYSVTVVLGVELEGVVVVLLLVEWWSLCWL